MALVGVGSDGGLLALRRRLFGLWFIFGAGVGGFGVGGFEKLAALPRWPGFRHKGSPEGGTAVRGLLGLGGSSGNIHSLAPVCSRQSSRMLCPSGWMTETAVLVKTIL